MVGCLLVVCVASIRQMASKLQTKADRFQPVDKMPVSRRAGGKMIAKESRQAVALERFIQANPQLLTEIAALSESEQQQQIQWAFEDEAQEQGVEPWELTLRLIAESPEELQVMRLEVHREVAEALGMSWEEYCDFNEIDGPAS